MTLAAISEGHVDFADVMFLVAFIIFALWFLLDLVGVTFPPGPDGVARTPGATKINFLAAGLACLALGWFVL